ncbi:sugar ABC transporter permease [Chloroflexi bacterium TSY]|nr:sugar ABC transporter permease [Chloroflexi bacterium TSY]
MAVALQTEKISGNLLTRFRRATWRSQRINWSGYLFVAPFAIVFLLLKIGALAFGLYLAFTKWEIVGDIEWVGLANFEEILDDRFARQAFLNTFRYVLVIVPGVTVVAFSFAVFVHRRWPGHNFARIAFFTPFVCAPTVIGLVWVWMLDTQFGLINQYLSMIGIPNVPWLTSPDWSWVGVSLTTIWWDTGFSFILFLAALQDVSVELEEAATVDGANRWQVIRHVVLPHLRSVISMVITLQTIASLRIFSQIVVMTSGGPAGSSTSAIHYLYQRGLQDSRFGYAAAVAVLVLAVTLVVTVVNRRLIREVD